MLKSIIITITKRAIIAIQRFPLPVLFSLLFCIIAVSELLEQDDGVRCLAILFCGCFWFISLKLFTESKQLPQSRYYLIGIPVFLAIAWYLFISSVSPDNMLLPFSFLGLGLFLFMFVAPFLRNNATSAQIWCFNYHLWIYIGFTIIAAIVLFVGIIAVFASLKTLFNIKFNDKIYVHIWIIIASLFSPIFAMIGIPSQFDMEKEEYPSIVQFILSYIILPLLLIYTVILYGYTAKIILTWTLPKGGASFLVSAFGCTGIIVYLASYPLHKTQGIMTVFSRYFFKLLLIPIILLAVAIGVRIHDYGITEERYTVLLCLIWFVISCFFVLVKRNEHSPKYIFLSAVVLLLIASFGPWGAVNVSAWSQVHRLKELLEKNQILVNGKIQRPPQSVSHEDSVTISSIVKYIVNTQKSNHLKPWFINIPNAHIHKRLKYLDEQTIVKDMGIEYSFPYDSHVYNEDANSNYFRFSSSDWKYNSFSIDIAGYDYLVNVDHYLTDQKILAKDVIFGKDSNAIKLSIKVEPLSNNYIVQTNISEPIVFRLEELIKQLDTEKTKSNIVGDQFLVIDQKAQNLAIRLIVNDISGEFDTNNKKAIINSMSTTLLIRKIKF